MRTFPTLYGMDKSSRVRMWNVKVIGNEIHTTHGLLDGEQQLDVYVVHEGKNQGRANETSPEQQAEREAESTWNKKARKNMVTDLGEVHNTKLILLPMLAAKFFEKAHLVNWANTFVQPKLNGQRCIASVIGDEVFLSSRNGLAIQTCEHIQLAIKALKLPNGTILDGELYIHGLPLQSISSAVKRVGPNTAKLQYHIYDKADATATFEERWAWLCGNIVQAERSPLRMVETYRAKDDETVKRYHAIFTAERYEGTMIRNGDGLYLFEYRSDDLLKLKDFQDAEFDIIGTTEGTGREAGAIMYICRTPQGEPFKVRPMGTIKDRKQLMGQDFTGKQLTVRFQEYSEAMVPLFPVGVVVRDYE